MSRLWYNKIQAARDIFHMSKLLEAGSTMMTRQSKLLELIRVLRNRRAKPASENVMFMQQVSNHFLVSFGTLVTSS